jgi:hypothetical protein
VIEAEIAKCDVRCANCHRRRTCERAGWWRQGVHEDSAERTGRAADARLQALLAPPGSHRATPAGDARPRQDEVSR